MDEGDIEHPRPFQVDDATRATLRLAATEAEDAMLRLVGICDQNELIPADELETLRRINRTLEDCSARLYAMSVRGAHEGG
jgi:hypothetical protein